jgi:chloramphenicol-sensitive protein RarD
LTANPPTESNPARVGVLCGFAAYGLWGFAPIYFRAALDAAVPPLEIVAHRVLWCVLLLGLLITLRRRWDRVRAAVTARRTLAALIASACTIALNWFLFIYAIETHRLMQASLGYFVNPLLSVLLGFVVLQERLRLWQWISVALAGVAVTYLTAATDTFPVLALGMAVSFACYGLIRKLAGVDAVTGLLVETTVLLPVAVGYLGWLAHQDAGHFFAGPTPALILFLAGPVTAIPLLLFVAAARRLRLATVGFLQYLAPSGQLLLAVLAYGEPFERSKIIAFTGIWIALAIYSLDTLRAQRLRRQG